MKGALACIAGGVAFAMGAHAAVQMELSTVADSTNDVSDLSTNDLIELLSSWGLSKAFANAFQEHEITGDLLTGYFKRGRVNEDTFAPSAQPFQWDALWKKLEQITPVDVPGVERRQLDTTDDGSGIFIKRDSAWLKFGKDSDTGLGRTGDGELTVQGSLSRLSDDGSTSYAIVDENMLMEALSNRACKDGLTGTFCNETCTDVSYLATAACLFHDDPSTDLQLIEAAAFIGYYEPDMLAATVQCCDDDSCTRKDSSSQCYMGSYTDEDPFGVNVDWATANQMCQDDGMRLCTLDEMMELGHGCCGGGCSYDYTVVWTSHYRYNCGEADGTASPYGR